MSIAQGDGNDVVGLSAGSALQDAWERRAADRGHRLNHRARVPSFGAQPRLIESGLGVAMLPEATAQRAARPLAIEVLPLSDACLVRRLLVCVRRISPLPLYAQQLVAVLRQKADARTHPCVPGEQQAVRPSRSCSSIRAGSSPATSLQRPNTQGPWLAEVPWLRAQFGKEGFRQ